MCCLFWHDFLIRFTKNKIHKILTWTWYFGHTVIWNSFFWQKQLAAVTVANGMVNVIKITKAVKKYMMSKLLGQCKDIMDKNLGLTVSCQVYTTAINNSSHASIRVASPNVPIHNQLAYAKLLLHLLRLLTTLDFTSLIVAREESGRGYDEDGTE